MGGFVIKLSANKTEAFKIVEDMIKDGILDETFASMAIEFVTYNPNYQNYVISTVTFQQSVSGLIFPITRCRAIRKRLYVSALDNFRAF